METSGTQTLSMAGVYVGSLGEPYGSSDRSLVRMSSNGASFSSISIQNGGLSTVVRIFPSLISLTKVRTLLSLGVGVRWANEGVIYCIP